MTIPVLMEQRGANFRASTQSPIALSADGNTADSAVDTLKSMIKSRLDSGDQLRTIEISDLDAIERLAGDLIASIPNGSTGWKSIARSTMQYLMLNDVAILSGIAKYTKVVI